MTNIDIQELSGFSALIDQNEDYSSIPLLSVGDKIPLLEGEFPFLQTDPQGPFPVDNLGEVDSGDNPLTASETETFKLPGNFDGVTSTNIDGTNYVFVNHSIGTEGVTKTNGGQINGSRISLLAFDKDWDIIGGRNLVERIRIANVEATNALRNTINPDTGTPFLGLVFGEYALNPETGNYEVDNEAAGGAVDPNTGETTFVVGDTTFLGLQSDVPGQTWLDRLLDTFPETYNPLGNPNLTSLGSISIAETGFRRRGGQAIPFIFSGDGVPKGLAYFHIANGTSVPIEGFGAFAKEQIISAIDFRQTADKNGVPFGQTVLLSPETSANDGELYMYVGDRVPGNAGGFADFEDTLYVLKITDGDGHVVADGTTITEDTVLTAEWVLVDGNPLSDPHAIPGGIDLTLVNSFAFEDPDGLAFDKSTGNLFAAPTFLASAPDEPLVAATTITELTTDGTVVRTTGNLTLDEITIVSSLVPDSPIAAGQSITALDFLDNGNLLVAAPLAGRIIELDTDGNIVDGGINIQSDDFVFRFGDNQTLGLVLDVPGDDPDTVNIITLVDVGADPSVAGTGTPFLQEYDTEGNLVSSLNLDKIVPGINPEGIVIDPRTGNFLISDDAGSTEPGAFSGIHEITSTGVLISSTDLVELTGDSTFADPEGLAIDIDPDNPDNRTLYVAFDADAPGNKIAAFQISSPAINTLNADDLSYWVNGSDDGVLRSTNFTNLGGIAEDPNHTGSFYLTSSSGLYNLTFAEDSPTGAGTFTLVQEGDFDSVEVDDNGKIVVQDNVGGSFFYDRWADTLTPFVQANQEAIDPYGTPPWELEGINATGSSDYLTTVVANSLENLDNLGIWGQLELSIPSDAYMTEI